MKLLWLISGSLVGLTTWTVAFAAIPSKSRVTDDTAIYQNLSEIRVSKQALPDFDQDIERLSELEGRYKENLPSLASHPRLKKPMERVSKQKYRFSGKKVARR